jgi:hypothetical protein
MRVRKYVNRKNTDYSLLRKEYAELQDDIRKLNNGL